MTRWGLAAISIGCILMIYSQTNAEETTRLSGALGGALVILVGALMVYKDKKANKGKK